MALLQGCCYSCTGIDADRAEQTCTALYRHFSRAKPQAQTRTTLCKQRCPLLGAIQPSPGASQPLPLSKACQTPEQAGLLWDTWHLCAAAERMTEAQQTSSQLYADAMAHCIKSNTQGCHGLTKQSLANGSQRGKFSMVSQASSTRQLRAVRRYHIPVYKPCTFCLRTHSPLFSTYSFSLSFQHFHSNRSEMLWSIQDAAEIIKIELRTSGTKLKCFSRSVCLWLSWAFRTFSYLQFQPTSFTILSTYAIFSSLE